MFIYKITNIINGKIYIGQTIRLISRRFAEHLKSNKTSPLYSSIKKHGIDSFTIEEIDGANNQTELNYKENLHIHLNNTLYPNGYNLKTGGNGGKLCNNVKSKLRRKNEKILVYCKRTRQKIAEYDDIYECSKIEGSQQGISNCLNHRKKGYNKKVFIYESEIDLLTEKLIYNRPKHSEETKNFLKTNHFSKKDGFSSKNKGRTGKISKHKNWKSFEVRELKTDAIIGYWESAQRCADDLNINQGNINSCLKQQRKQHRGYTFSYIPVQLCLTPSIV